MNNQLFYSLNSNVHNVKHLIYIDWHRVGGDFAKCFWISSSMVNFSRMIKIYNVISCLTLTNVGYIIIVNL